MNEEIFRKKSLERVKSPENLDDYIRVANPGIWLLLASVIILLAGACVWGAFGHIDSTVQTAVRIENGNAVCYIAEEDVYAVRAGMTVKFEDSEAAVLHIGDKGENGYVCSLTSEQTLPDGYYAGKVVTESRKPLSFVLN